MSYRTIKDYNNYQPQNNWPVEWPILEKSEINKGTLFSYSKREDRNCACLIGWIFNVTYSSEIRKKIAIKIIDIYNKLYSNQLEILDTNSNFWKISKINDTFLNKQQCADLWNKAGEEFGYTE